MIRQTLAEKKSPHSSGKIVFYNFFRPEINCRGMNQQRSIHPRNPSDFARAACQQSCRLLGHYHHLVSKCIYTNWSSKSAFESY